MNNDRMPTSLLDLVFSDLADVFHSSVDVSFHRLVLQTIFH